MKFYLLTMIFGIVLNVTCYSEVTDVSGIVNVRGIGSAPLLDGSPGDLSEKQAVTAACINAIDRALELQSDALRQQYSERVKGNWENELQVRKLISDIAVQTEKSPKEKITSAKISGKLDMSALRDLLNGMAVEVDSRRSNLGVAVFFTVRRSVSKTVAHEKAESRDLKQGISTSGEEEITDNGVKTVEAKEESSNSTVKSANTIHAESIKFAFDPQMKDAFGTGLMTKLAAKGFDSLADGSDFDATEAIDEDTTNKGFPSSSTRRNLLKELQEDGDIQLYILGKLDFSIPGKDPITGMVTVNTTMTGKVYRITPGKKRASLVAGLGPKSFKGKGRSEEDAKKHILEAMAPLAADEIITALQNKGIVK